MIDLLRDLVAAHSLSGSEADAVDVCERAMRDRGYRCTRDEAGNLVGERGDSGPLILFDAHVDTVAATPLWTHPPLELTIADGRAYGLGTTDMKGPITAAIMGLADAAPAGRVALSITTLEEVAEGATLRSVCERLRPAGIVICEPTSNRLALGQRGRAEIGVTVHGRGAHAAYPEHGENALLAAARLLAQVERHQAPDDAELGSGILVPTEAQTMPFPGISIVPSSCQVRFDRRLLPGETERAVVAELERYAEAAGIRADVSLTIGDVHTYTGQRIACRRFLPAWRTPPDLPLAAAARVALGNGEPTVYRFCTNGSLTAGELGLPTIGYGPGHADLAHQPDEWIDLADLEAGRRGYAALAAMSMAWAAP